MNTLFKPQRALAPIAVALIAIAMTPLSQPSAVAATNDWSSAVTRPANPTCATGETAIKPDAATTDMDGVTTIVYNALPGFHVTKPPANFDPAHSTARLNSKLHIAAAYDKSSFSGLRFKALMASARSRVAPAFCFKPINSKNAPVAQSLSSRPVSKASQPAAVCVSCATHVNSSNWSGYVLNQSDVSNTLSSVTAAWNVQSSGYNYPHNKDVTWVGIGGAHGAPFGLIQAGTAMETGNGYRSWFEWVGNNGTSDTGVSEQYSSLGGVLYSSTNAVAPGDTIFVSVYWQQGTVQQQTDWEMCYDLEDLSTSTGSLSGCQPRQPPANHPTFGSAIMYDHTSMEWIDERDTLGYPLSDFWQTGFFDAGQLETNGSIDPFTNHSFTGWIMGGDTPQTSGATLYDRCTDNILAFPANAAPMATTGTPEGSQFTNQFCNSVQACIPTVSDSGSVVKATVDIACNWDHLRAYATCSSITYVGNWVLNGTSTATCPGTPATYGYQEQLVNGGAITSYPK